MVWSPARLASLTRIVLGAIFLSSAVGCGMLAEPDRIVVAEMNGKKITRGDLFGIIYDMPDDKRPNIRSRQDYLRVLNSYIDAEIKIPLGQELEAAGKITIPREIAREQYFSSIIDEEKQKTQRHMWSIPVPKPGEESELMKVYNIGPEEIQFAKNVVDQGTDQIMEELLGMRAVAYLANEAYNNKELTLDEETLRLEYELSKDKYRSLERLTILGLQFPTDVVGASAEAVKVRERVAAGEDFDAIFDEYLAKDLNYGIESVIENNPELERFKGFWQEASGAEVGEVRGPIFMPTYGRMAEDGAGQVVQKNVPECYLIFKVIERQPSEALPFEQAIPMLAPPIAFSAMMERLRDQHGVVIYEDKLPNPHGGTSSLLTE